MSPELQAKLVALKAHYLGEGVAIGRPTLDQALSSKPARLSRRCADALGKEISKELLLRRVFYLLIIAECTRTCDALQYREDAQRVGRVIQDDHRSVDPFPFYMKIVGVTTAYESSDEFGNYVLSAEPHVVPSRGFWRFPEEPCEPPEIVGDDATDALGLTKCEVAKYESFLVDRSLESIVAKHGLAGQG